MSNELNTGVCATRRDVLCGSAAASVAVLVDGVRTLLRPAQAREKNIPLTVLTDAEARTLEALGERLHPGAAQAGMVHFVDSQLAAPVPDSLLIARHFLEPPYTGFYRAGLGALDTASKARHELAFHQLSTTEASTLVADMRDGKIPDWRGPPAPLFYLILRGDAVDVVYATMEDFHARLDVPYMPHILPPRRW